MGSFAAFAGPTPFDPLAESMTLFPAVVRGWIAWLVVVGVSSVFFAWRHAGARWVLGAYVCNHAVAIGSGQIFGAEALTNGLVSVTHVVFWTPAVFMLIRGLGSLDRASVYGVWHIVAMLTMAISLFFDYRDTFIFLS